MNKWITFSEYDALAERARAEARALGGSDALPELLRELAEALEYAGWVAAEVEHLTPRAWADAHASAETA